MKFSKTDFLIYRYCAYNAWVKIHRPDGYRAQTFSVFDLGLLETVSGEIPSGEIVQRCGRFCFVSAAGERCHCGAKLGRRNGPLLS